MTIGSDYDTIVKIQKGGDITDNRNRCIHVTEQYYSEILHYCQNKLPDDPYGAEDCTQETFLLLYQKRNEIDFKKNIRGWLYASADRIISNYQKKRARILQALNFDMTRIEDSKNDLEQMFSAQMFDCLSEDDLRLLKAYYGAKKGDRRDVAKKYNLTLAQLYKKVHAIRDKIREQYKS